MAEVRLEGLGKRFDGVTAVVSLDLSVRDGEFLALLGPSGCGKTTTLRMIAALEHPSEGRVFIGGRDVTAVPARRRDLAMVFQDYALYPHMTVADNIGYPLRVRRRPRAEIKARVTDLAQVLGLEPLLGRRPGQLSGGQQQRAALARSLVYQPQALLLDEPLSNLDAKLRLEARGFLRAFQRRLGITTVYVTHDQAEAMALADRVAVMDRGRLLQVGPPLEVYRRPAEVFVAGFIGSPPMNLLEGAWRGGGFEADGLRLEAGTRREALIASFAEGAPITAGVRPEQVRPARPGDEGAIAAETYAVETLGVETLVRLRCGGQELVMRLPGDVDPGLREGERTQVVVAAERVLWYRPDGALAVG